MLKGENIELRPIKKNDLIDLNKWKNDYEIFKYLGGGFQPQSIDEHELYMEKIILNSGSSRRFIIAINKKSIGFIGLYDINWINRNCELGVYIGNKEEQGKGYGKEAVKLVLNFAFNNLNMRKIKLKVVSNNIKAIRMYESIGFQERGILKEERYVDGSYMDLIFMELFNKKGEIV